MTADEGVHQPKALWFEGKLGRNDADTIVAVDIIATTLGRLCRKTL